MGAQAASSGSIYPRGAETGLSRWLTQTKLQPPLSRSDVVRRPRLLTALRDALAAHRLILLSAPAGYGKTTLLTDLRFALADSGPPPGRFPIQNRVAWLTLDEGDNDPILFLSYLIAALQRLEPTCGAVALSLLSGLPGSAPRPVQVMGVLINDILETLPDPFVLILDDLHRITEAAVFIALDYLLEHMPPQMRLIIATRYDPPLSLARLRGRGQMAELRLSDLAFRYEETAAFLNDILHLGFSVADLDALQSRTEGWPAGLRLLAGSLERISTAAERTALIASLIHTDRHIFEFLAAEVLERQPPALRTFLLETAVLPELTPHLCEAVTGRRDAEAVLEDLERRNLFLVPLATSTTPTYRYHALFAEFLRRRLEREMPERVRELHRRAAEAQTDLFQAVEHYLAAEMWEQAASAIERVGRRLLRRGMLDTLYGWLQVLPESVVEAHPHLLYLVGLCLWGSGRLGAARRWLEGALRGFEGVSDEMGQGCVLADMAVCAFLQADFERSAELFNRALELPLSVHSRIQSLMGRAGLMLIWERWSQAMADFEAAERLAASSADPNLLRLPLVRLSPVYAFLPGGMERMEHICRLAREIFGDQISPTRVIVEEYTALLHLWQGRPAEAVRVGELALSLRERLGGGVPFVGMDAAAMVLDAYVALGDYAAAERYIEPMLNHIKQSPLAETMMAAFLFEAGRVYWLQGRLEEARRIYAQMCAVENPREWPMAAGFRARMAGMVALSEKRYGAAEQQFRIAVAVEQRERVSLLWGSARVPLAYFYLVRRQPAQALQVLKPLLVESERRGILSLVISNGHIVIPLLRLAVEREVQAPFASRLLDILGADDEPRPTHIPATGETLTRREVEVLRLIAQGLSNRAIAERLVISEGTVKSHVHRILRKLDVASRTEAAVRARELLPENSLA